MKDIRTIAIIISARMASTRVPKKMTKPFANTTLFDIVLKKLTQSHLISTENIYISVYEDELKAITNKYNLNIFSRSEQSANNADDPTIIYEWWDKLPSRFEYFVLINPCLPLLSIQTIENFINNFITSDSDSMFSTISKKNFIFMDGVMINHFKHFPPPHNKIMNTQVIPPWQEAAHCLYAGRLENIQRSSYLGSFDRKGSPELFDVPIEEFYDIDYPWEFEHIEALYKALNPPSRAELEIVPGRWVGPKHPVFIVAEIGCNHQGNLEYAEKMIIMAKKAGADAVKFQKRTISDFMTTKELDKKYTSKHSFGDTYRSHRENLEFSLENWKKLQDVCDKIDIIMFASVWDEQACDDLNSLNIPLFKIASADLRSDQLIKHVLNQGKPVLISTGMSDMSDVEHMLTLINQPIVLMQCTSIYPCDDSDINLAIIPEYISRFGDRVIVGYSGHEQNIEITFAAVAMGACVVERHFTFEKQARGSDHEASLEFGEFCQLVKGIRRIEAAYGSSIKQLLPGELKSRQKLAKSLVYKSDLKRGHIISFDSLIAKSPGHGIPPSHMLKIIGKTLIRDVEYDSLASEKDW